MTPLTKIIEHGTPREVAVAVRELVYRQPEPKREEILFALGLVVGRLERDWEQREALLQRLQTAALGGPPQ